MSLSAALKRSPRILAGAPRAPGEPLRFERIEHSGQLPPIEHDPHDQSRHDGDRDDIGAHDERRMRAEIHYHAPATASACIISMVRTRRRRISLRMAARCSVRNNSVNAAIMVISGMRMVGWMVN